MITLSVLAVVLSMTAGTALASASNTNTLTGGASHTNALAEPVKIHWDAVYDRSGNPRPAGSIDAVSMDSLYFKNYNVTNTFYGCPKSQVPNPTPANCRPAFSFLSGQSNVGMDPQGNYAYEANGTSLRRHNTDDGTFTDYTISGSNGCIKTDGNFLYVPVDNVVYKYTMTGTLVNQTTISITPNWYNFSVANDTVWCGTSTTLYGYACSKFSGGSISEDATWDIGTGTASPAQVTWDGQFYYVSWAGYASNTFKQFNADRTLSASGTIALDTRGPMCRAPVPVSPDSLYFKAYSGTQLMSSDKVASPSPVNRTPMAFQYDQATPCMDPKGNFVYEAYNTNLRRFSTMDGSYTDFTLSNTGGSGCATDGNFIYRPSGTSIDKYTMTGTYVNTTTIDISCDAYSISVCGDTLWCTNDRYTGVNYYGYACARFTGGSIGNDAVWNVGTGTNGVGNVAFDGTFYYIPWIGTTNITFKRFDRNRALYSTGTLSIDSRSVMCRLMGGVSGVSEGTGTMPASAVAALEVAPNPFHRLARISYALNKGDRVSLKVYNITGALVTTLANGYVEAGRHTVHFDGSKLAPGIYLLRLEAGSIRQTKKIVLQ
jgi:hypothetical protein